MSRSPVATFRWELGPPEGYFSLALALGGFATSLLYKAAEKRDDCLITKRQVILGT